MKFQVPARLEELAGRLPPQLRRYRALLIVLLAGVLLLASGRGGGASAAPRQADGGHGFVPRRVRGPAARAAGGR